MAWRHERCVAAILGFEADPSGTTLVAGQEMLLVEVNHRAKNSLMVAASLLPIQGRRQPDPDVRALFEEAQSRLQAMARVHDLLSKSESSQCVDLARYVTDLCEALRPLTDSDGRIRLERDTEEGILVEPDVAFSLGIVLTELITNAVKYASPPRRAGTILTRSCRREDGRVEVTIQGDGVAMASLREGSLGYGLVRQNDDGTACDLWEECRRLPPPLRGSPTMSAHCP